MNDEPRAKKRKMLSFQEFQTRSFNSLLDCFWCEFQDALDSDEIDGCMDFVQFQFDFDWMFALTERGQDMLTAECLSLGWRVTLTRVEAENDGFIYEVNVQQATGEILSADVSILELVP